MVDKNSLKNEYDYLQFENDKEVKKVVRNGGKNRLIKK